MLQHQKALRGPTRDTGAGRDSADIVIVGNGIAGLTAAVEARYLAPEKSVAILTEQSHPTINTPALKQFAIGKLTQEQLLAYPAGTEHARQIRVINARVEGITSRGKYVTLEDGQRFGYGSLLLATGDGILHLKKSCGNKDAALSGTGRAYAQRMDLALSFNTGYWKIARPADIHTRAALTQARGAIIDVLHTHDRPMKPGEIALALGKRPGTIRTMLHRMKACNEIQATDQGYIALIPKETFPLRAKSNNDATKERVKNARENRGKYRPTRNITQFQRPRPKANRGVRASTNLV